MFSLPKNDLKLSSQMTNKKPKFRIWLCFYDRNNWMTRRGSKIPIPDDGVNAARRPFPNRLCQGK